MSGRPNSILRHLAALGIGIVVAAAVAGVVTLVVAMWAAAAIGVAVGQLVAAGLRAWDDRYFPDHVVILGTTVK